MGDSALSPTTSDPGTVPAFTPFWNSCSRGDPDACDYLYLNGDVGSVYEEFGFTCGGRAAANCNALLGDDQGTLTPQSEPPGRNDALDNLWNRCGAGTAEACDQLRRTAPALSRYQWFGYTCGGRGTYDHCSTAVDAYGS